MNHRIAMLTSAHPHDDPRIYHRLSRTLAQAGWRIDYINAHFEGMDDLGIRFVRVPLPEHRFGRMLRSRSEMLRAVLQSRADICTIHDPELLPLLGRLKGHPMLTSYDAHEDLPLQVRAKGWIAAPLRPAASLGGNLLLQRYLPQADGVLAATEGIAQKLKAFNQSVSVVRNRVTAADCALFDEAVAKTQREPGVVCYAGALSTRRGLERMIRLCAHSGVRLLLAGAFESDALMDRVRRMPEYSCVEYCGRLDRPGVAALYARASAGLLLIDDTPAYRESEPIKLFEYLCAGLPVLACDFAHWRGLAPPDGVVFVPPQDDQAMAQALAALAEHPPKIDAKAMRRRFSFEKDEASLLGFYEQLEEKGRRLLYKS